MANAICHRDYTSLAATTIRLYDNHLAIWNPGNLSSQLSPADLLQEHNSYPPNKLIAEAFYNVGLIERWGTGTLLIADALKAQGSPPPEFDLSSQHSFKLMMRTALTHPEPPETTSELNERQLKAIEYLRSNKTITNAEYQNLAGTSKATATRDIAELIDKGLVIQTGRGKVTAYRLAKP